MVKLQLKLKAVFVVMATVNTTRLNSKTMHSNHHLWIWTFVTLFYRDIIWTASLFCVIIIPATRWRLCHSNETKGRFSPTDFLTSVAFFSFFLGEYTLEDKEDISEFLKWFKRWGDRVILQKEKKNKVRSLSGGSYNRQQLADLVNYRRCGHRHTCQT